MTALVETVVRAANWARGHPDDTVRFIAREIGASEDAVVGPPTAPQVHEHLALTLDAEQIGAIEHFKDFLLEWGFLPADFDVRAWVDPRPLGAALGRLAA